MDADVIIQLTGLLKDWDTLLAIVRRKLESATLPANIDYYTHKLNKLQPQRDELAAALASAMAEGVK